MRTVGTEFVAVVDRAHDGGGLLVVPDVDGLVRHATEAEPSPQRGAERAARSPVQRHGLGHGPSGRRREIRGVHGRPVRGPVQGRTPASPGRAGPRSWRGARCPVRRAAPARRTGSHRRRGRRRSSHPSMSGAANRVHAVSLFRATGRRSASDPAAPPAPRRNDGLLRKRSPMRTVGTSSSPSLTDRTIAAASPSSQMFTAVEGDASQPEPGLEPCAVRAPGPPVQRHGLGHGALHGDGPQRSSRDRRTAARPAVHAMTRDQAAPLEEQGVAGVGVAA